VTRHRTLLRTRRGAQSHGDLIIKPLGVDMTTTLATRTVPSRTSLIAVLGLVTAAVFSAVGVFWDATGNDDKSDSYHDGEYLDTVASEAAVLALVFGLVVRTAAGGRPGRRSVVLGVLGVAGLLVFWSGAPCILATGAVATALIERDQHGRWTKAATAAVAMAGVAGLAAAVLAFLG
jgi:hypothetical protein